MKPVSVFTIRMVFRKFFIMFLFRKTQGRHFALALLSIRFQFYLMDMVILVSSFVSQI